ncbi:MAG: GvpL/GvpF family gas vesicle protein [Solirubrobacterales bacterium]
MGGNDGIEQLRRALSSFAAERVPGLIAEAEAEALAKARRVLGQEMLEALIARAGADVSREKVPEAPVAPEADADGASPGYYVYGVVESEADLPEDLVGIDGRHAPFPVREGQLTAIASHVDLAEFGEESLRENLEDVRWLEGKARAHEEVLEAVLTHNTVIPLRLCTIYKGEDQVRDMLRGERLVFTESLQYLRGRAEVGVKAIVRSSALKEAALQRSGAGADTEGASSGVQYLHRKRIEGRAREEAAEIGDELAHSIHQPLAELAVEALLNPLQRPEVSGHEGDMILNGVYLVEHEDLARFREAVETLAERFREQGLAVQLTGPWPPYNFVKGSIEAAR